MFFYNGVENLDNSLPVKEIFKNGDVVTAYYGAIPSLVSQTLAGGNEKNIKIICERDVNLTLRTRYRGLETHVSNQKIRAIDFKNYDKEIEIYWDTGRKNDVLNQKIFQGNKYQLDKGKNIREFRIKNDGLYKVTLDGEIKVDPIEEGLTKIRGDFLNNNDNYDFQNTGDIPLYVVSGRKENWDANPPIAPGAKQPMTVKKNSGKYEFGLIPDDNTNSMIQGHLAQMFDSKLQTDVESFNVWKTFNGPCGASAIHVNGETFDLKSNSTEHYREKDRINWKTVLTSGAEVVGGLAGFVEKVTCFFPGF